MKSAQDKKFDNPVWREGENWLTAEALSGWSDPQGYVVNIYLWQWLKYLPTSSEPYSQDALNAGVDGYRPPNSSKDDLKKCCQGCANQ